jgi:phosphonate metabolism protein PhnN/1,5-bisphosphokinase (PRPP-forming)
MGGSGTLVLVVGASGVGKDTLMTAAKAALASDPRFVFPRRVVTRAADATLEDHKSIGPAEFAAARAAGAYALSWDAHGLSYGLPVGLEAELAAGRVAVFNASRGVVTAAAAKYPGTRVLLVEARPDVRAMRLAGRGRESAGEIALRLAREVDVPLPHAIRIDNSGALTEAVERFTGALLSITRQ